MAGTTFECPNCQEPFRYDPSPNMAGRLREMELRLARACAVWVNCPHCPALLHLDRQTCRASLVKDASQAEQPVPGLFYDLTLTEAACDEVSRLNQEGHRLRATEPSRAEALFRQAAAIRKHDPVTWYNIGVCRHSAGDPSGAVDAYRHALRFDGHLIEAWNNLGLVLFQQGLVAEAEGCFDAGLAVDPSYPKFYLGKANVAWAMGRVTEARELLRTALQKEPHYQPAQQMLQRLDRLRL